MLSGSICSAIVTAASICLVVKPAVQLYIGRIALTLLDCANSGETSSSLFIEECTLPIKTYSQLYISIFFIYLLLKKVAVITPVSSASLTLVIILPPAMRESEGGAVTTAFTQQTSPALRSAIFTYLLQSS